MAAVARLTGRSTRPLTELVRLRGARQHDCRLCASRRSVEAIEARVRATPSSRPSTTTPHSDLPEATKAALALVDAMIWTPTEMPGRTSSTSVREHLTDAQAVEVVLDVARNAANKIAVALRRRRARGHRGRAALHAPTSTAR